MNRLYEQYVRKEALPTVFCPGCGDGTVLQAFLRAVDQTSYQDRLALVGGIGCSGWIPTYVQADVLHTTHGRAIPFAMGLKLTDPSRKVVVFTGDGDCVGIGGNHFLHAARRNVDMTVILINNQIYGMTGGQMAPTTPYGGRTQTSPYGNAERSMDACGVAIAAGATFVARWTAGQTAQLAETIKQALDHPGFAFIEVLSQCPVQAGPHLYGTEDAPEVLNDIRARTVSIRRWDKLPPEEREGKWSIGLLHRVEGVPEFAQELAAIRERAQGSMRAQTQEAPHERASDTGRQAAAQQAPTGR